MKNLKCILFSLFILVIIALFIRAYFLDEKIKKSHKVVCGKIQSINSSRGGWILHYEFFYNSHKIRGSQGATLDIKHKFELGNTSCLIVLELGNPHNCIVLQKKSDFEKFSINIKDTIGLSHCWY